MWQVLSQVFFLHAKLAEKNSPAEFNLPREVRQVELGVMNAELHKLLQQEVFF